LGLSTSPTLALAGLHRAAKLLIKRYGEDAPIHAAMRADELAEKGDVEGRTVWIRIMEATRTLLDKTPPGEGQPVHQVCPGRVGGSRLQLKGAAPRLHDCTLAGVRGATIQRFGLQSSSRAKVRPRFVCIGSPSDQSGQAGARPLSAP
jgi:hypothetical protein